MKFIYIVGAQCTGKTTLCNGLIDQIHDQHSQLKVAMLSETARHVLELHQYTKNDVRGGGQRCLELQRLILHSQLEKEREFRSQGIDVVVSDRCAVDPLVYAAFFCGMEAIEELLIECDKADMMNQLRQSTIVLCEPIQEWLFDDGTRLMPLNMDEWHEMHSQFRNLLEAFRIDYIVLTQTVRSLTDRVNFVLAKFESMTTAGFDAIDIQNQADNDTAVP